MWRILGILLLIGVIATAVHVVIILLILAGLIFRTKETLAILVALAAWSLFLHHPFLCLGFLAVLGLGALYRTSRKQDEDTLPTLTRETTDETS